MKWKRVDSRGGKPGSHPKDLLDSDALDESALECSLDELREFVNRLMERQRPSLEARFEELASRARLAGWQGDVQAFRLFNRIRNALLHRGTAE